MPARSLASIVRTTAFGAALLASGAHASEVVSDDLLTSSNRSSPWQVCDSDEVPIDITSLDASQCAYRTTPARAGTDYRLTCGVHAVDYASITLAFLDGQARTLATSTTDVPPQLSGANAVTLAAPAGTTIAAVGIYGESGSGFQDCVLVDGAPPAEPTKGSIAGGTWFDENTDSRLDNHEDFISGSPIVLLQGGEVLHSTRTDSDGQYFFGNLDIDECYVVRFGAADAALRNGALGGDNDALGNGATREICLTQDEPNIVRCDASFVPTPPVLPPPDHAVCGVAWIDDNANGVFDATDSVLPQMLVELLGTDGAVRTNTLTNRFGNYAISDLDESAYRIRFVTPDGHEPTSRAGQPVAGSSFVQADGVTPAFSLPADRNTPVDSACSIEHVNAGFVRLPVALEPTLAVDDGIVRERGVDFGIDVLANDTVCENEVEALDLRGHNVPGNVSVEPGTNRLLVSGTTASGHYAIEYGVRGTCGSHDTATVAVELTEPAPIVTAGVPDAPDCRVETGGDAVWGGVDVFSGDEDGFAPRYELYDRDRQLVITLSSDDVTHKKLLPQRANWAEQAWKGSWEIEWNGAAYGFDQVAIHSLIALNDAGASERAHCVRTLVSPIALDLPNRGRIEVVRGDYLIDIDGDGVVETLREWFAPSAGILVSGTGSGRIDGRRLFGNLPGVYSDGFEKLATLDADASGFIEGIELDGLSLWTDLDSDSIIDAGELGTLTERGIERLPLTHHQFMARAELVTGRTMLIEDVWLPRAPVVAATR